MYDFFAKLFSSDLMPHGMCYLWRPEIVWLHAVSDSLISLAYFSIPISLAYFVRKRRDLPFHWIFLMFGIFIFGCGSTHVMEIWTLWNGTYRLAGVVKAITAAASIATAIAMFPLVPKALALPKPDDLRAANELLETEVAERRRIEADLQKANIELQKAHAELERRVEQRTQELAQANEDLQNEIASRRQLEERMRQTQKMEALGRLAGGVAHDFNNLLMAISGYNDRIAKALGSESTAAPAAANIRKACDQAALLTRQLLAFSRKQNLQLRVVDLNNVVAEMNQTLLPLLAQSIEVTATPASKPAYVRADPGQLHQVILNLALNARDAMPEGGRLRFETANLRLEDGAAQQHNLPPGEYVRLEVKDDGSGLSPEARTHLFEPFFTTKASGTGLGLSTVYGVIHQSGGSIQIESAPEDGTTVCIYLPRAVNVRPEEVPAAPQALAVGGQTILLVEDAAIVRSLVRDLLIESGCKVIEASDGNEAIAVSGEFEGKIDLLITDLMMPRMNGYQLAERIRAARPGIKTVYMSAYPPDSTKLSAIGGEHFLQKPFTADDLAEVIRRVFEA
jgi:signal transduction histidine kinase